MQQKRRFTRLFIHFRLALAQQGAQIVRLGMAHILAFHVVDDVLADVLAAIADPLDGPRRPQDVEHLGMVRGSSII